MSSADQKVEGPLLSRGRDRFRALSAAMALGLLAALPAPSVTLDWRLSAAVVLLWFLHGALAWASWYRESWVTSLWAASWLTAWVCGIRWALWWPLVCLTVWGVWVMVRRARMQQGLWMLVLAVGLAGFTQSSLVWAQAGSAKVNPPASIGRVVTEIPKSLLGYSLDELTVCGLVDGIPWKHRPDGKRTRLVIRDKMRLATELKFSEWQVFQVMDRDGFITYIFRKPLASGRFESLIARDTAVNRVVDTPRGRRTVDVQDLKPFINRSAFQFVNEKGSTLSYAPGPAGRTVLTVQVDPQGGRALPPLFLRGIGCERPPDEFNTDVPKTDAASSKDAASSSSTAPAGGTAR